MKKTIFILAILFSFCASAQACLPVPTTDDQVNNIEKSAYFIGLVRLLSQDDHSMEAIYEVLVPYKVSNEFSGKYIKVRRSFQTSCNRSFGKTGAIYEEIFVNYGAALQNSQLPKGTIPMPREKGIQLIQNSDIFSNENFWSELKGKTEFLPEALSPKKECEQKNGVWDIVNDNNLHRRVYCRSVVNKNNSLADFEVE